MRRRLSSHNCAFGNINNFSSYAMYNYAFAIRASRTGGEDESGVKSRRLARAGNHVGAAEVTRPNSLLEAAALPNNKMNLAVGTFVKLLGV